MKLDVLDVQLQDRTALGRWGNHVVAQYAVIFLLVPGCGPVRAELHDPRAVWGLKQWLKDQEAKGHGAGEQRSAAAD